MKRILTHVHATGLLFLAVVAALVIQGDVKGQTQSDARLPNAPPSSEYFRAQSKSQPQSDKPVTSIIDGNGADTLPTLRVQSDLLGAYKNLTSRNSTSLQSVLQATLGDWVLDMLNYSSSPQRTVLVDLRDPVDGSGPNGGAPVNPFGETEYQYVRARFIAKCSDVGNDFRTMQPNNFYNCPLAIAFDDAAGVRYRLTENPSNFGETNWVQVTCVATDASAKCNQWKLSPSAIQPNGEVKNIAKLLKVATKPNQADQDYGDFYISFGVHLTNP